MKKTLTVLAICAVCLVSGYAVTRLAIYGATKAVFCIANKPVLDSDIKITRDIAYGAAPYQKLDIYEPHKAGQYPAVVFFYGSWKRGEREDYAFVAGEMVRRGYVVVIPDTGHYPDVHFPVFVQDGAKVLAWTKNHIARYRGRADRIDVLGYGAGAHIGALLASDPEYLKAEKETPKIIRAFAGLGGPYDFSRNRWYYSCVLDLDKNFDRVQVANFITGREPPMFLAEGKWDMTVPPSSIDALSKRIMEKGGVVKTKIYPGLDHRWILGAFAWFGQGRGPVAGDVDAFFRAHS